MTRWYIDFKTKIKEDNQASAGNEIHSNVTNQFFRVMDTGVPSYTRMNGQVTIIIPEKIILTRGLSKCVNWKKAKELERKCKQQKG